MRTIILDGKNIQITRNQYPELSDDKFYQLIALDPTYVNGTATTGDYGVWILTQYKKNPIAVEQATNHMSDLLSQFIAKKSQLANKDINFYKTIEDLENILSDTAVSNSQKKKTISKTDITDENNATLVADENGYQIWIPHTYAASCKLGRGTSWCTATTSNDYYYNSYTEDGDLYIIIDKKNTSNKWQIHLSTNSFMDSEDNEVSSVDDIPSGAIKIISKHIPGAILDYSDREVLSYEEISKIKNSEINFVVFPKEVTNIIFPDNITELPSIVTDLYLGDEKWLDMPLVSVTIPEGITSIPLQCFYYMEKLRYVGLPSTLKYIGEGAFYKCTALKDIAFPDSIEFIAGEAFEDCNSLNVTHWPRNLVEIGYNAFYGTKITSAIFKNKIEIDHHAFSGCPRLKKAYLPKDSVISSMAFSYNDNLDVYFEDEEPFIFDGPYAKSEDVGYTPHYGISRNMISESRISKNIRLMDCNNKFRFIEAWTPSKNDKQNYIAQRQELDKFCKDNNISVSMSGDSYYFTIEGQDYRISNHTIEKSDSGMYRNDPYLGNIKVRDSYHTDRDTISFTASKLRVPEIYNNLKVGLTLDKRGRII